MEEIPSYYSILIPEIRYSKELNDKEKLLYSEITALSNKNGYCYASNKYFAELYDVTPVWISKCINHLKELGFIDVEIIKNENNNAIEKRIIKIGGIKEKFNRGIKQNFNRGIKEKFKDNNINMNNININIYDLVEEGFGRTLNGIEYEEISKWPDTELTRYAIKQAILSGGRSVKYIQTILNSYKAKGILSVDDAINNEEKHKNKTQNVPKWFDMEIKNEERDLTDEEQKIYEDITGHPYKKV